MLTSCAKACADRCPNITRRLKNRDRKVLGALNQMKRDGVEHECPCETPYIPPEPIDLKMDFRSMLLKAVEKDYLVATDHYLARIASAKRDNVHEDAVGGRGEPAADAAYVRAAGDHVRSHQFVGGTNSAPGSTDIVEDALREKFGTKHVFCSKPRIHVGSSETAAQPDGSGAGMTPMTARAAAAHWHTDASTVRKYAAQKVFLPGKLSEGHPCEPHGPAAQETQALVRILLDELFAKFPQESVKPLTVWAEYHPEGKPGQAMRMLSA